MKNKKLKVGLALGGGGARGCAHIGVIKALREAGIEIDMVAGTSIGSLIGGILSAGDIDKFEKYLLTVEWKDVVKQFDPAILKNGIFEGKKVKKLIEQVIDIKDIKNARIPYAAIATNILSGKEVIIKKGNMVDAIRASVSIPGIFIPHKKGSSYFVDGGVVNPMPVNRVKEMGADIVIAVDLNHQFIKEKQKKSSTKEVKNKKLFNILSYQRPNFIDIMEGAIFLMEDQLTQLHLKTDMPDILIRPNLKSAGVFDFHKAKKLIKEGYKQMKKQIPTLKKVMQ